MTTVERLSGAGSPQRRVSLHEEIVGRLRDMVLGGELPPGRWIPELKLCAELTISRTPLREALKVLASENLVTLMPNRGAMVTEVVPREIEEIFEVVNALEVVIGRLVVAHASDEDLAALTTLHRRMVTHHARGERTQYFSLNQDVHKRFADLTGNRTLAITYAAFAGKIRRARALANISDARWAESVDEHEAFMAALVQRDADRFAALLHEHSRRTGVVVCEELQRAANPAPARTRRAAGAR